MKDKIKIWALSVVLAITTLIALSPSLCAEGFNESKANKVKAAYLYNFAKFITWPKNVLDNHRDPFVIGVLGDQQFAEIIRATVKGKKIAAHQVVVQLLNWRNRDDHFAIQHCHILYISKSENSRLDEITDILKGHPVLLVGESSDFTLQGGMIGFVLVKGKIIFEINRDVLEQATLKVSSKLLKLARIVWGN